MRKNRKDTRKKICRKCGRSLLLIRFFRKNRDGKDGYRNVCKMCQDVMKIKKEKKEKKVYPFFSEEILAMIKYVRYTEINKFGVFYGILVHLKPKEILAISVVVQNSRGSQVFNNSEDARHWLYKLMIISGEKTKAGLTRKGRGKF